MKMSRHHNNNLLYRLWAQGFLLLVAMASLVICPYSKVEESFYLQAVHDLFYYGLGPAMSSSSSSSSSSPTTTTSTVQDLLPYDHRQYPGVVPRSFVGPWILSVLCQCVRLILFPLVDIGLYPNVVQFLSRFLLLLLTVHAWGKFAHAVDRKHPHTVAGPTIGVWILLITACQFHLIFYASRMLPNCWATMGTLYCYAFWMQDQIPIAAICLVATTAVIRCDLLLLLFTCGLSWLYMQQLSILRAIRIGTVTGLISLLLTVPLDSLLWGRILWPEGMVLYFNTILNKSSEWGVSAWHWYWTSAIPKAMLFTALLTPMSMIRLPEHLDQWERTLLGIRMSSSSTSSSARTAATSSTATIGTTGGGRWVDTTWLPFLLPALGFVALYSALGHKEVRFLFPALPLFNLAAAVGLGRLQHSAFPIKDKRPTFLARVAFMLGCLLLVLSFIASCTFVAVSRWNYPGGVALEMLVRHLQQQQQQQLPSPIRVHIDVASAMTGVSLFGQRSAQNRIRSLGNDLQFIKAGYEDEHQLVSDEETMSGSSSFTYRLSERANLNGYRVVAVAAGNPKLDIRRARIVTTDVIYVLERVS